MKSRVQKRRLLSQHGFTLVELAMVLVIVGILVAMGSSMIGPLTKRAKISETKEHLNADVESLIGYAAGNNRLPALTPPPPPAFSSVVRNLNDSWGNQIRYIVDGNLTSTTVPVCSRKATSLSLNNNGTTIADVAFVLVSTGENFNNQTQGDLSVTAPTTVTTFTNTPGVMTDAFAGDFSRPEEYDDIVRWVTLNDLKFKLGCSGQQLKILNRDLPTGQVGTPYSVDIYADSSLPVGFSATYRWCVQPAAGVPGLTFNPAVNSANCLGLAENLWGLADHLSIAGTPTAAAPSQPYTIFLRDNADPAGGTNDNIAQKNFVLTVNP